MTADDKQESMKAQYTLAERVFYQIRRHLIFAIILVPSFYWLYHLDPLQSESSLLVLLVTRASRSALGVMLAVLFAKFAFPKVAIQTEIIEEHNVAVALLFAAIIIGVNL